MPDTQDKQQQIFQLGSNDPDGLVTVNVSLSEDAAIGDRVIKGARIIRGQEPARLTIRARDAVSLIGSGFDVEVADDAPTAEDRTLGQDEMAERIRKLAENDEKRKAGKRAKAKPAGAEPDEE